MEVGQFLLGLSLRNIAHPVESVDTLTKCLLQVVNHAEYTLLARLGEVFLAVHLADGLAQDAVDQSSGLLPQGVILRLTCQRLRKCEVRATQVLCQTRGTT